MAAGRMSEAAGLVVVAGTHYRHMSDRVQAYEMVMNGAIGDIISVNCYFNMGKLWHVNRQEGWSDIEAMIRDWVNWRWLSGDHIVEQHIHELDTVGWFMGKHPVSCVGFGGRHRRLTGDQNDFFSVDYVYMTTEGICTACAARLTDAPIRLIHIFMGQRGIPMA